MLPPNLDQWMDEVLSASALHDVEPVVVFAHLEVETQGGACPLLDKPGPEGRGDKGHGHGLMQIDDRTWREWISRVDPATGKALWMNPAANIAKGTEIIAANLRVFCHDLVPSIAAYNAGPGRVRSALRDITRSTSGEVPREAKLAACDALTEHGSYVTRVLAQIARLNPLLESTS